MKILFKWDGDWNTIPKDIQNHFGKPVTSVKNLGVWKNGHFINCKIGDYVVKNKNNYEVLNHAKAKAIKSI